MNKIRLNVDGLSVESFTAGAAAEESTGTVHANLAPTHTGNCATCGATCFTSCAGAGGAAVCTCPIP
ncbi:MAG: hypothetical protein JO306_02655 [Gemmatimonadetes bacterium]|nr:hypothetical protein [Gemmatimonadota bacterium]